MTSLFFPLPADWRRWLAAHHKKENELWVGFYKRASGKPSITWPESVDEALCFGWIDGLRKSVDDISYPGYQRTAIFWVVSAKQEETRSRRLDIHQGFRSGAPRWAARAQETVAF